MIFQDESSEIDTELSFSCHAESDERLSQKRYFSPLFIQEREEPANLRQAHHSHEESLLPAQSFSVCHSRTGRPVHELSEPQLRKWVNQDSPGTMKKEQILADCRAEIQKHEFQADSDRRSIQIEWNYRVSTKWD